MPICLIYFNSITRRKDDSSVFLLAPNSNYLKRAVENDQTDYQMGKSRSWNGICLAHFVLGCVSMRSFLELQWLLKHLIT